MSARVDDQAAAIQVARWSDLVSHATELMPLTIDAARRVMLRRALSQAAALSGLALVREVEP